MSAANRSFPPWRVADANMIWRRYGKTFLAVFLIILTLSTLFTYSQTDQYEATTRLVVEKQSKSVLPTREVVAGQTYRDADIIDTEVETLYSILLAREVVTDLKLFENEEFAGPSHRKLSIDRTAAKLMEHVDIRRVGETYLIDIIVRSRNAEKAAKIANAYAQNYLELQERAKQEATRRTNDLLADRIEAMAAEVEDAERRVQQFKIANDLMSINGATLAEQSIAAIDNDLARAKSEESAARGKLQAAAGSGARLAAAQTPALESLVTQRAVAEQEWQEAAQKFGERHPSYLAARSRAEELRRAVLDEVQRARASHSAKHQQEIDHLRSEARAASQKRASLSGSVQSTRRLLTQTNAAQVQLNILERKADAVRATYEAYLVRFQETATEIGAEQPDARIISPASIPFHASIPNKPLNITFGFLIAFFVSVSVVMAKIHFSGHHDEPAS